MGTSFVNYQIRSTHRDAVVFALRELLVGNAYVSPSENGWITIYDQASESQDSVQINRLAENLSKKLKTCVLVLIDIDSEVFVYYLFDTGDLIDEYNSNPNYFGGSVTPEHYEHLSGQPGLTLKHCGSLASIEDIEDALSRTTEGNEGGFATAILAEDRIRLFAAALGIDPMRATAGYNTADVLDLKIFTAVTGKFTRIAKRLPVPPRVPPKVMK